jgi:ubiquinone/menaquinone biosynthesis C-methylase UbiE
VRCYFHAIMTCGDVFWEMTMATLLSPEDAAQLRTYEQQRHDALAEGYIGFFAPVTALAIAPLLEAVRLAPGTKLLDVPTGSGALAAEATRRGADVVGVDISSGMIAQARKLHPGIDFRVGEVEHLPVADCALEAVVCAFGLGHFPYPEASVTECLRTLKPGGRIAFSWWDTSDKQRVQGLIRDAAAEVGAKPPPVLPKGHSSLRFCDAGEFRRLLEGAGLADITLQEHRATHLVADVDALWNGALGGMALTSSVIVYQDAPTQAAIRAALERRAAAYKTPRGLELPIAFRIGAGRKPG